MASNRNYLIGQIYNLSGEITANRILLAKLESAQAGFEADLKDLEKTSSDGQALYEVNKKIKELKKNIDRNEIMIEKTEDILDNKEEMCVAYQKEVADSKEYEFPQKE